MRQNSPVVVTVREGGGSFNLTPGKENLLTALLRRGCYTGAVCAGKGSCGRCRIQVLAGTIPVSLSDADFFTKAELEQGHRLSCKAYPEHDCTILVDWDSEAEFEVLSDFQGKRAEQTEDTGGAAYGIAIDIGTTTIAMNLVDLQSAQMSASYTAVNHQRGYGGDVISRIQAANEGGAEELREILRRDLLDGIKAMLAESGKKPEQVRKVVIAANTTMNHLLLGYSCETLGTYPFLPVNVKAVSELFEKIMGERLLCCEVVVLPGISAFVGGDIVSGLFLSGFARRKEICLLIDLGTNGEMAVGNRDRIFVTSVAAGPAFEGGTISCGMGSVPGAIHRVTLDASHCPQVETIGGGTPSGLCGTGVIEIAAELRRTGLMDETGLLEAAYFEHGFELAQTQDGKPISFMQKDIREIQLAKAAIRAGIETLIKRSGITYGQLGTVYLAGGFGLKLNPEKAARIGMIPEELVNQTQAIGNSALGGAVHYLTEPSAAEEIARIEQVTKEINLSLDPDFSESYLSAMYFIS